MMQEHWSIYLKNLRQSSASSSRFSSNLAVYNHLKDPPSLHTAVNVQSFLKYTLIGYSIISSNHIM